MTVLNLKGILTWSYDSSEIKGNTSLAPRPHVVLNVKVLHLKGTPTWLYGSSELKGNTDLAPHPHIIPHLKGIPNWLHTPT